MEQILKHPNSSKTGWEKIVYVGEGYKNGNPQLLLIIGVGACGVAGFSH